MEYLSWLLAVAFAVLVIVFAWCWLRAREAKLEADTEHMLAVSALEKEKHELSEALAASENESERKTQILELIDKTQLESNGKVWLYAFDKRDGSQIIGADGEELEGTYRPLPKILERAAEKGRLNCIDTRYSAVTGENTHARVYFLNDVTDKYTIKALGGEIENLHTELDGLGIEIQALLGEIDRLDGEKAELIETIERADAVTTVMNMEYFYRHAEGLVGESDAALILVKTEADLPQAASFGKSREIYLRSCADRILESFPDCIMARYSEESFCCLFVGDTCETANEKADRILTLLTEQGKLLSLCDGNHIDRNVLEVADYRTGDIRELVFCLAIKSSFDRRCKRFGVQSFGAYDYDSILKYRKGMEKLVKRRKIRFKFSPIACSTDAKVYAYQMTPYFPDMAFGSFSEALDGAILFGYTEEFEEILYNECMRVYRKAISEGLLFHDTKVIINSIPDACMSNKAEKAFHEKYFDELNNLISEISEEVPSGLDAARVKRKRMAEWGASCVVNCTEDSGYNMIRIELLSPQLVRVPVSIACSPDSKVLEDIKTRIEGRAKLLIDGISTPKELRDAIAAGADYISGDYVGPAEYDPACVTDRCMKQIGLIKFGKKKV